MKKKLSLAVFSIVFFWIIALIAGCSGGSSGDGGSDPIPSTSPTTSPTVSPTVTGSPTPTPTSTPFNKVYAIIIGIDDYPGNGDDLEYCVNDADDLKASFENCGLWKDAEITQVLDTQGEKSNIRSIIQSIKSKATSEDLFVMTFSGHGTNTNGHGALIVWDGNDEGYITDEDLGNWIDGMACPMFFHIDSCEAGGLIGKDQLERTINGYRVKARLRTDAPGYDPFFKGKFNPAAYVKGMETINNIVVTTATADGEIADENEDLQNGLFTYYVVQGLGSGSGVGPADTNGDGRISAQEVFYYTRPKVVDYSNGDQNPQMADNYPTTANPTGSMIIKQ